MRVIKTPYCAPQHLLWYESPVAYTVRKEGWGADIYSFDGIAIVTGYAPFGDIRPAHDVNEHYNTLALDVIQTASSAQRKSIVRTLISRYIEEVIHAHNARTI